jgi:hypothetical protein
MDVAVFHTVLDALSHQDYYGEDGCVVVLLRELGDACHDLADAYKAAHVRQSDADAVHDVQTCKSAMLRSLDAVSAAFPPDALTSSPAPPVLRIAFARALARVRRVFSRRSRL